MKKNLSRLLCAAMALVLFLSGCTVPAQSTPDESEDTVPSVADVVEPPEIPSALYVGLDSETDVYEEGSTPFSRHGALSVHGPNLVDEQGERYQLYGMSTHGIAWYPKFINADAFLELRDQWNVNCVRLAMYTAESGGYCTGGNQEKLKSRVRDGVQYATDLGMYVIIDWHILRDENPLVYIEDSKLFFEEMSALYADRDNIIYEICSEPNGATTWSEVTEYANTIIPIIRANDPNALIIVGTPTWSQDINKALDTPLEYDNIMYALHFYAGTHKIWLREKLETCLASGLPVFISEMGTCGSDGGGDVDHEQSQAWKDLIDKYNLSYMCWNFANKKETCSVFLSTCRKTSGWTDEDMSEHGRLVKSWFLAEKNQ